MAHLELPSGRAIGYQQFTVTRTTVLTLTIEFDEATGGFSQHALVQAQGGALRFRVDNADPTANIGMILPANDVLQFNDEQRIRDLRIIADTTANTSVSVTYFA